MTASAPDTWPADEAAELQAPDVEFDELLLPAAEEPADTADISAAEPAEVQCPHCGELLAWHDEFASCAAQLAVVVPALPEPQEFSQEELTNESVTGRTTLLWRPGKANFAYELGSVVQPTPAVQARIIWRGQLKERHPATGLVHRVNVYRLNDGYWDCYREEELQAA